MRRAVFLLNCFLSMGAKDKRNMIASCNNPVLALLHYKYCLHLILLHSLSCMLEQFDWCCDGQEMFKMWYMRLSPTAWIKP